MSDGPTQADIIIARTLTRVASAVQSTIFLAVASLMVMVFDTIITMDQEVKFIWSQRWSFGKAVFLFIRHFSTLLMIGHVSSMILYDPSPSFVVAIAGSSVLIVRTWLLCGGSKRILVGLIIGLILVAVPSIIFVALENIVIVHNPAPALFPGCLVQIPADSWRPFIFPLIYETAVLCITLFKAYTIRSRTPILMRLFRDGTLYYVVVIAVLVVTTAGITNKTMRPIVAGSGYHIASVSIGCSRLILSLHSWSEAHKPPSNPGIQNSNGFSVRNSDSQPPSYELKTQKIPDIESASVGVHMWRNNTNTIPPPVPPKDHILQSTLPNIERPSLPERMWSTLPSAHAHRDQRHSRPPRSSSLYVAGQVPDRLVLETPMATVTEELS